MTYDFAIVGAGLADSVLAERLASQAGKTVLLLDKRPTLVVMRMIIQTKTLC